MTTKKSRAELNDEYGKIIVGQPLSVWSALNKAVERDTSILNTVMHAKSPYEARIEDEESSLAKDTAKN